MLMYIYKLQLTADVYRIYKSPCVRTQFVHLVLYIRCMSWRVDSVNQFREKRKKSWVATKKISVRSSWVFCVNSVDNMTNVPLIQSIQLSDGNRMPAFGLGTCAVSKFLTHFTNQLKKYYTKNGPCFLIGEYVSVCMSIHILYSSGSHLFGTVKWKWNRKGG